MRISSVLVVAMLWPLVLLGQNQGGVEELRASIVKITSKAPDRQPQTGTGFIVFVDGEIIYIATAAHVVDGDPKPQVTFYHDKRRPVAAEMGDLERDNLTNGLGYVIVRDRAIAAKVKALRWSAEMLRGGEDVLTIGFGQGSGEWGVIKGTVASASGSEVRIDGKIEAGNSGGPIIVNGGVAGVVTATGIFGVGKSGVVVQSTLRGWDIEIAAPPTTDAGPGVPATPTAPPAPRWRSHEFPAPNAGQVVFAIMPDGNPACASYDSAQCLWGVAADQIDFKKLQPLVCGEGHRSVWGATGYEDPKHWCNLAKRVP